MELDRRIAQEGAADLDPAVSLMHVVLLPGQGHERHNHPDADLETLDCDLDDEPTEAAPAASGNTSLAKVLAADGTVMARGDDRVVLTAAHCLDEGVEKVLVYLGVGGVQVQATVPGGVADADRHPDRLPRPGRPAQDQLTRRRPLINAVLPRFWAP